MKYIATVQETFLPNNDSPAVSVITTTYEKDNGDTLTCQVIFV